MGPYAIREEGISCRRIRGSVTLGDITPPGPIGLAMIGSPFERNHHGKDSRDPAAEDRAAAEDGADGCYHPENRRRGHRGVAAVGRSVTGGKGRKDAASGSATLADPGYPDGSLTQITYGLLKACGLSYVVSGAGALDDLFDALRSIAPVFNTTQVKSSGIANLGGRSDSAWIGVEGPNGSAIIYYVFPDADSGFVLDKIGMLLPELSDPWDWGIATVDASVPLASLNILQTSKAVEAWNIRGLEALAPATPANTPMPASLAAALEAEGWDVIEGAVYKSVVPGEDARTQLLFLSVWDREHIGLMSPVADSPDGSIPDILRGRDFGDYRLDVMGDMVMLVDLLPYGPPAPSLDTVHSRGLALGKYADQVEAALSIEDVY
jgi:hypothetical protein